MAARIIAGLIVIAAVAGLALVALGGTADTGVARPVATTAEPAAAEAGEVPLAPLAPVAPLAQGAQADASASNATVTPSDSTANSPDAAPTATSEPAGPPPGIENLGPRMDLVEIDGWLNTDATSIDEFNGKVILVEMWTFGCHNCKARIPFNQSYNEEFANENFQIIGVHAPEFSYEAEVPNIIEAAERLGVTWPIALDTEKKNFRAWQPGTTNFWPRTMVIDQNGDIRYDHIGEGRYEELRTAIRWLLDNPPPPETAS